MEPGRIEWGPVVGHMEPKAVLVLSVGLLVFSLVVLVVVAAERSAIERTLQEIRSLPES